MSIASCSRSMDLRTSLQEVEELLQFPGVAGHLERAEHLLMSIARNSPSPGVTDAAMKAITLSYVLSTPYPMAEDRKNLKHLLAKIRGELAAS